MRFDLPALTTRLKRTATPLRRCLAAVALVAFVLTARAWAYDDMTYNFTVEAPDPVQAMGQKRSILWLMVKSAQVPGEFRIGWLSNEGRNSRGASIHAFVMLLDKAHTARELLDANIKDVTSDYVFKSADGKKTITVSRKGKFRIVKQGVFKLGNLDGFQFEVVAPGTGAAIPQNPDEFPKGAVVPTRQRWYAVVRGQQVITLLFTCPDANLSKYASVFSRVEKSLKVN